jgi:hypothetical protein
MSTPGTTLKDTILKPITLHELIYVTELSRRDSPNWHMRLAVGHVNYLPKTLLLVLFCALYFLHPRWVFA